MAEKFVFNRECVPLNLFMLSELCWVGTGFRNAPNNVHVHCTQIVQTSLIFLLFFSFNFQQIFSFLQIQKKKNSKIFSFELLEYNNYNIKSLLVTCCNHINFYFCFSLLVGLFFRK